MLRCAKNRGNTKEGVTSAGGRTDGRGQTEGGKKEEQRIMPTTVPFIPELEQRASKPKSRKRNTEITTVSQLKGNGCFNSRYVDSFFFFSPFFPIVVVFLSFFLLLFLFVLCVSWPLVDRRPGGVLRGTRGGRDEGGGGRDRLAGGTSFCSRCCSLL